MALKRTLSRAASDGVVRQKCSSLKSIPVVLHLVLALGRKSPVGESYVSIFVVLVSVIYPFSIVAICQWQHFNYRVSIIVDLVSIFGVVVIIFSIRVSILGALD